ncbi:MAG TPA: hypothetical protein ENI57_12530 [Ignavibacteria bacterium]|nr:hypothetical protein [Ignavibacteria bacterium]
MKQFKNRKFDYTPQFYKPDEDEKEKKKEKLGFRRQLKAIRRNKRNPIIWVIITITIILVYFKLKGII